jgi:hypothetical protein
VELLHLKPKIKIIEQSQQYRVELLHLKPKIKIIEQSQLYRVELLHVIASPYTADFAQLFLF